MYISEIDLKNYRKFDHLNIKFDKNLSVLVGKNGTGKNKSYKYDKVRKDTV